MLPQREPVIPLSSLDKKSEMASGLLKTHWASEVSPKNVWLEYPRPQMARKEWLNLNGLWDYAFAPLNAPAPQTYEG